MKDTNCASLQRSAASPGPVVLTVPGLYGSDEDHWQTLWELTRPDCRRAQLGAWEDPTPALWVARLEAAIRTAPGPVVLVAHSLGCIATTLWAQQRYSAHDENIVGALLVAPCDTEKSRLPALRRFAPVPTARLPFASTVVVSEDDPYASVERGRVMAHAWGSRFVSVGAAGHINSKSNLGAWPAGQALLAELLARNGDVLAGGSPYERIPGYAPQGNAAP